MTMPTLVRIPQPDAPSPFIQQIVEAGVAAREAVLGPGFRALVADRNTSAPVATMGVIRREAPNFKAFREFCGRNDTCFVNALVMALASIDPDHYSADCTTMNAVLADMVRQGFASARNGTGGTMSEVVAEARSLGFTVDYEDWEHWHPLLALDRLHILMADLRYDEGYVIVLQIGKAYALPDNEQNVFSHFVADGGVDTRIGYLIGNGDIPRAVFHGAEWVGWASIMAANPTAVAVFHPRKVSMTVAERFVAAGWHDSKDFDPAQFDGVLTAPSGLRVVRGNRVALLSPDALGPGAPWDVTSFPTIEEVTDGTVSAQTFVKHELGWTQETGVAVRPLSPVGRMLAFEAGRPNGPPPAPPATPRQIEAEHILDALGDYLKGV